MVRLPGAALHYEARHIDLRISPTIFSHLFHAPPPTILAEGFMNVLGSRDFIRSSERGHSAGPSRITIFVLFTGVGKTLDALWSAGRLARDPDAHIEIIAPEIVPYPPATRHRRLC